MTAASDKDPVSEMATTGHEWDGITELNTPLPRWWVWLFYATIIWSIGYWLVYPAFPLLTNYTKGVFGFSSRGQVATDVADLTKLRAAKAGALESVGLDQIEKDPTLLALARAQGRAAFGNNCAPCHGLGATGAKGYPNLNDDDWLWGGTLEDIHRTIEFGVRSGNPEAHESQMLAFGKDGLLKPDQIMAVANYVRSLSGLPARAGVNLDMGRQVFAENCMQCHGENGKGNRELGAPNLTDKIWLYGSDEATIIDVITNGRGSVMPAWVDRLDPVTIKALAVYVHTLGGGK
jgi:cytochrome c oxidase cbb3-type subunit III